EYACRAGSTTQFFWGDRAEEGQGYLNAADAAPRPGGEPWRYRFPFSDGFWRTAPVKSFRPNAWGLYDMAGNACEWCRDWYGEFSSDPATDPKGPRSGEYRVVRGGSWYVCPVSCRSAYRYRYSPAMAGDLNGFRVCRLGSGG
ncbi:MAG: SUMF1/EgtB/PvdO family nonheme iron enzyme, partial [Candidatus Sumerlaeota bacterium]|nr:SUMF1/EgtB/PvdO family nonheme iron enzyme [Candidatus Sumerlaeota bacterium]